MAQRQRSAAGKDALRDAHGVGCTEAPFRFGVLQQEPDHCSSGCVMLLPQLHSLLSQEVAP